MNNFKIKVNTEAESKEAQELFFELGYSWNGNFEVKNENPQREVYEYLVARKLGSYPVPLIQMGTGTELADEITLPQLRDMVVLKLNDVGDATHTDPCGKEELKFRLFGEWWNLFTGGKWQKFCHKDSPRCSKLKPIEKPEMKEYLDTDYVLRKVKQTYGDNRVPFGWVEVPEGSDAACVNHEGTLNFYKNIDGKWALKNNYCWTEWYIPDAFKLPCGYDPYSGELRLVWEREADKLTSTDDQPMKEYLNKLTDGTYKRVVLNSVADGVDGLIEVPEGATFATGKTNPLFRKDNFYWDDQDPIGGDGIPHWRETSVNLGNAQDCGLDIVWQRSETLNDKVATTENHREYLKTLKECGKGLNALGSLFGYIVNKVNELGGVSGIKCGDDVTRAIEAFEIMSGKDLSLDEHVVRDFINVYELTKQLKG